MELSLLRCDDYGIIEPGELPYILDLQPSLVQQSSQRALAPLLCVENYLHCDTQCRRILDARRPNCRLFVGQDLVVDHNHTVGPKSRDFRFQNADARIIIEVVEDLAEVVDTST